MTAPLICTECECRHFYKVEESKTGRWVRCTYACRHCGTRTERVDQARDEHPSGLQVIGWQRL